MPKIKLLWLLLCLCCSSSLFAQSQRDHQKEVEALNAVTDSLVLQQKISALKAGSEEDLTVLLQYYFMKGRDPKPIVALAVERFPQGEMAFGQAFEKVLAEKDPKQKIKSLNLLKRKFPKQNFGNVYALISGDFARAGQFKEAMVYLDKTTGSDRSLAWSQMAMINNEKLLREAESMIDKALLAKPKDKEERSTLLNLKRHFSEKRDDYKQAAEFSKQIIALNNDTSHFTVDHYYYLLSKSGQYQLALPGLEKAISRETENEEIKNEFRKAYQFVYPEKNVQAYLDSLSKRFEAKYKSKYDGEEIAKHLVKIKAPDFKLLDTEGKEVTMEQFKGKMLVIDFWATWCMPCKAALPGMQLLVNKYKADTTVKFLFIHTKEFKGTSFEKVKGEAQVYFKEHDYQMPLYFDMKAQGSNENKVADAFQVKGIPHKVIVDKNGFTRLNSVGFYGSTPELVAELSAAIEEIKKLTP